jgi:FKBP-type peptidyl-prolyl cis-trans isomerase SlyD
MSDLTFGPGRVIGIYYTVRDPQGRVVDSSSNRGAKPMAILAGAKGALPGLEQALLGKKKNDRFEFSLAPEQAFGLPKPELVDKVERASLPVDGQLEVGMRLSGKDREGRAIHALITQIEGERLTLDRNHPLAGQTLHFEVTVAGVREAKPEEIQHGHPHGPGGHQH